MKRFYFLLVAIIFMNDSFAQNTSTLGILGEAKKKVTPDVAIIQIALSAKNKTESISYKQLTGISNSTLNKLKDLGFKEEQIKITDFSVSSQIQWTRDSSYKTWVASQSFVVKFPLDKQRILEIYENFLTDSIKGTSISFKTECSDALKEKVQNELIEAAIDNANARANLIAKKTHQSISGIKNIQYKYSGNDGFKLPIGRFEENYDKVVTIGYSKPHISNLFTINELEFNEEINISYNLKAN